MSRGGALPGSFPRTLFADDLPPLQSPASHVVDAIGKLDSQRSGHDLKMPVSPLPAKLKSMTRKPLFQPEALQGSLYRLPCLTILNWSCQFSTRDAPPPPGQYSL